MHDPLDSRAVNVPATDSRARAEAEPQATDREVPLDARELPQNLHAWLDGEQVAEAALSGNEREVALWKRIDAEAGRRRRMVTPAHVPAQILAKLADD